MCGWLSIKLYFADNDGSCLLFSSASLGFSLSLRHHLRFHFPTRKALLFSSSGDDDDDKFKMWNIAFHCRERRVETMTMKDESKRLELGSIMNIFIPNINAVKTTETRWRSFSCSAGYIVTFSHRLSKKKGGFLVSRFQLTRAPLTLVRLIPSAGWLPISLHRQQIQIFLFSPIQLLHVFRHAKCTSFFSCT